jgi:hypothetical protein
MVNKKYTLFYSDKRPEKLYFLMKLVVFCCLKSKIITHIARILAKNSPFYPYINLICILAHFDTMEN